jgi:hypothetical protein
MKMANRHALTMLALFLVWAALIPSAFVTLYTIIELQSSARNAVKGDTRLAPLNTVKLAKQLNQAEADKARSGQLAAKRNHARLELLKARTVVRVLVMESLTLHGVKKATELCTAPLPILKQCQIDNDPAACATDWLKIQDCYDQSLSLSAGDKAATKVARDAIVDARNKGYEFNELSAQLRDQNKVENDPLLPIAEVVRAIRIPWFNAFFVLPQGVIVACFTSVMAALGAGVASLVQLVRQQGAVEQYPALVRSFVYSPLLGGLTGFLVYFVVSAGTGFLVQPAPADPAQATNNLSAPALASLGILAGLAAENAIGWLQNKANSFFASDTPTR